MSASLDPTARPGPQVVVPGYVKDVIRDATRDGGVCCTVPLISMTPVSTALGELAATCILLSAVCTFVARPAPNHSVAVQFTVLIFGLSYLEVRWARPWRGPCSCDNQLLTLSTLAPCALRYPCSALLQGPYTGASMNPMRSFVPAVWTGVWDQFWVGAQALTSAAAAGVAFVWLALTVSVCPPGLPRRAGRRIRHRCRRLFPVPKQAKERLK